jgi:hypothetical protein
MIINDIILAVDNYIEDNQFKHITEFLLDEILLILEVVNDKIIINKIKGYDLSILDYSTKFKIMKVVDKYSA